MKPVLFLLLVLLVLLPGAQPAFGAHLQEKELAPSTYWRVGFLLTTPPTTENLSNLPATSALRIRSDVNQPDLYFVVPRTTLIKVSEARMIVFDRTGSSAKAYTASVEVFNLSGAYERTLSVSALDLQSAPLNTWNSVPLQGQKVLYPDEIAVIHIHSDAGSDGDLSLGLGVEIKTINGNYQIFLPSILR